MSEYTKIHWTDGTTNPSMGCEGCELFPKPALVVKAIETALAGIDVRIDIRSLLKSLINQHFLKIKHPSPGHINDVTLTNAWHFRELLRSEIAELHGTKAGRVALAALKKEIKCYAAKLHCNRAANILQPDRKVNKGYAPTFEQVKTYAGRTAVAASWKDQLGLDRPDKPWANGLARMIFISDMGDSLWSRDEEHFAFLERDVVGSALSDQGLRHIWLWLTKRPGNMRAFANRIGGMPANFCAMTTVTGPKTLGRVDQLRKVQAHCRGLSIEPLWARIPPEKLDLTGIDWMIVGGESGSSEVAEPFHAEWALELREHCRKSGTAFFLKQLGRNPYMNGKPLVLADPHGGDWDEWPANLRVREFPAYFHQYRAQEVGSAKAMETV